MEKEEYHKYCIIMYGTTTPRTEMIHPVLTSLDYYLSVVYTPCTFEGMPCFCRTYIYRPTFYVLIDYSISTNNLLGKSRAPFGLCKSVVTVVGNCSHIHWNFIWKFCKPMRLHNSVYFSFSGVALLRVCCSEYEMRAFGKNHTRVQALNYGHKMTNKI